MKIMTLTLIVGSVVAVAGSAAVVAADKSDKKNKPHVAAKVGDDIITEEVVSYYAEQRKLQAPNAPAIPRDKLIEDMVNTTLMAQEFDRLGLVSSNPEAHVQLMYTKAKLLVGKEVQVSDDDVKKLYDSRYTEEALKNFSEMEYHTRHILLKTEEEAVAVIKELKGGADFASLARKKSEDKGSGGQGGDLGWYKPASLVRPYSEAMQSLKVGELTDAPVQSQFGWHVIELLEEPRKAAVPTLAEKQNELRGELFNTKLTQYIDNLRGKAKVKINPPPEK